MLLQTKRLTLREVLLTDLKQIHELLSLKETDEFNTLGIPENIEKTAQWVLDWSEEKKTSPRNFYTFSVELTGQPTFVGLVALYLGAANYKKGKIWIKLHSDHWNKGYATECLKELLQFGFRHLQLHRIEAGCAVENIASKKVIEKAGFVQEGLFRDNLPIRGKWVDNYEFAMLDTDFERLYPLQPDSPDIYRNEGINSSSGIIK